MRHWLSARAASTLTYEIICTKVGYGNAIYAGLPLSQINHLFELIIINTAAQLGFQSLVIHLKFLCLCVTACLFLLNPTLESYVLICHSYRLLIYLLCMQLRLIWLFSSPTLPQCNAVFGPSCFPTICIMSCFSFLCRFLASI